MLLGVEEKFCRQVVPTGWKKYFHLGTGIKMSAEKTKTTPSSWLVVFHGTEIDRTKFSTPSYEDRESLKARRSDTAMLCSGPAVNSEHELNFYGMEGLISLGNRGNTAHQDSRNGDERTQDIEHEPEPVYRRGRVYQNGHQRRSADCHRHFNTNDNTTSFAHSQESVLNGIGLEACRTKSNRRRPDGRSIDSYARQQQDDLYTKFHFESSSKFENRLGPLRPRPRPPVPRTVGHRDKLTKIQEFEKEGLSSIDHTAGAKRGKQAYHSLLDSGLDRDNFRPPQPYPPLRPPVPRPRGISYMGYSLGCSGTTRHH